MLELLRYIDKNIHLWITYEPTYHEIQKNPRAKHALKDDEGVKFMRAGWKVVLVLLIILYAIGARARY